MKKMFVLAALLFTVGIVFSISQGEIAEAKRLVDFNASCANLSSEQLELIVELTIPKKLLEIQHRLRSLPGVMGVYDVTGDTDSILLVACQNTREFNKLIKKIHEMPEVQRTNSHVVLNVVKDWSDFVPV